MRGSKLVRGMMVASVFAAFTGGAALAGEPTPAPAKTPVVKVDKAATTKVVVNKNGKVLKQTKLNKQVQAKPVDTKAPTPAPDPAHKP